MTYLKTFYRKKSFIIYLILEFLILVSLLIIFSLQDNINFKVKKLNDYYTNRELSFITDDTLDEIKEKTKNINNIIYIYKNKISLNGFIENEEYEILPYIKEKNLTNYNISLSKNDVILPSSIFKQSNINKSILINNQNYNLNVVSLYDDIDKSKIVYISDELYNNFIENENNIEKYIVIVDKYENVSNVIENLENLDYHSNIFNTSLQSEVESLNIIKDLYLFMIIVILVLDILLFQFVINNIIKEETKDIAILKSIGYTNFKLNLINLFKLITLLIISFLLVFLLTIILNIIFKNIFEIKIIFTFYSLIFGIISLFITNLLLYKKIKNINPIEILK